MKSDFDNFILGFDASAVNDSWTKGKYCDDDGTKKDVFEILKNHGVNWIRLRIWNEPKNPNNPEIPGASNLETVINQAKRAKSFGLKFLLDFHYSDYWADPGKQAMPHEWVNSKTADEVSQKLYDWTEKVLQTLNKENASPDMIQIGNEINTGILKEKFEKGKAEDLSKTISGSSTLAPKNYLKYLESGINAAHKNCPDSKIMLHVAEGGGQIEWLLDMYENAQLDYDVIGLSYYPFEKTHGTLESLDSNIRTFQEKYKKSVVIAETAHPCKTDYQKNDDLKNATANLKGKDGKIHKGILEQDGTVIASVQNQKNVILTVASVSKQAGAKGFFTWGGEYLGKWRYAMFDENGLPLSSLNLFKEVK